MNIVIISDEDMLSCCNYFYKCVYAYLLLYIYIYMCVCVYISCCSVLLLVSDTNTSFAN